MGCLTYVSTTTRPDIAAAVVTLSQFMSDPSKEHWMGVKRMLRYIKGILGYGVKFSENLDECNLYGLGRGCRQSAVYFHATVTKSTTEAECVLSQATQEAIYLRKAIG